MTYEVYDIRVKILQELRGQVTGGNDAYLSGVFSGLKIQSGLMTEHGLLTYQPQIVDYIQDRHEKHLSNILSRYNGMASHENKLKYEWFVGECFRRSRFADRYYAGLRLGMQYVARLYPAFCSEYGEDEKPAIQQTSEYLKQVEEWVDEAFNLRSHLHR